MSATDLTNKVRELKELKVMSSELEAEITAIEDEIKAIMTARNTVEMTVDVFKVRWIPVTSNRFDTTAFKATHAELYKQYTKATTSRRFSIA
jgi:predicted phage-related endonuclease